MKKSIDLGALVQQAAASAAGAVPDSGAPAAPVVTLLDPALIDANDANFYDVSDVDGLASSIAVNGLLEPLTVTPTEDGRYRLISGHRRLAAWQKLAAEAPEDARWRQIPAFQRSVSDRLLEELMLIQANSASRVLSSAEISLQAERLTAILYDLKSQGYDFPGRMRDVVAEALNVSKSKLARLKVIRDRLVPEWLTKFDKGQLTESAAEALSQQTADIQTALLHKCASKLDPYTVRDLADYYTRCQRAATCPATGSKCDQCATHWRVGSRVSSDWLRCPVGAHGNKPICCSRCDKTEKCADACPRAADAKAARAAERAKREKEGAAVLATIEAGKAQERAEKLALADASWQQFEALRAAADVSVAALSDAMEWPRYYVPLSLFLSRDKDMSDYSRQQDVAGALSLSHARAAARTLGVTIDRLLGDPEPPAAQPAGWRSIKDKPDDGARCIVLYRINDVTPPRISDMRYLSGKFCINGDPELPADVPILGWMAFPAWPPRKETENA